MQQTTNARGGINKLSNREKSSGLVGITGTGQNIQSVNPNTLTSTPQISNIIPVETVIDNPPTTTPVAPPVIDTASVGASVNLANSYLKEASSRVKPEQQAYDATSAEIRGLMSKALGESPERQSLLEQAGIPDSQKQLDRMLSRIRFRSDSILQNDDKAFFDQVALEGQGSDSRLVGRNQAAIARERAIQRTAEAAELRTSIAAADLLQGDIENATANVDAALKAKYDPIKQALAYEQFFLSEQKDFLTGAKKEEADARINLLKSQQKVLDDASQAVSNAVASGGLQPGELEAIMKLPPDQQQQAAQEVLGRVAASDRALTRAAQSATIMNANLARERFEYEKEQKGLLIDSAMRGDETAIDTLGYDPRSIPGGVTAAAEYEKANAEIQQDIDVMSALLSNDRGLKSASGALQSAALGGFFSGGKADGAGTITRFVPGVGNVQGAIQTINDKQDFQSGLAYLVNSTTFDAIMDMRASGVTFGNMTEGERIAAGRAANELNAAMEIDESGKVIGVNASEEKTRQMLSDIMIAYMAKQEELRTNTFLSPEERQEIANELQ